MLNKLQFQKYRKAIIIFIVALLILFPIIYHFPSSVRITGVASSITDKESSDINVSIDIKKYKYFFAPTIIKGTLTVDNARYVPTSSADNKSYGSVFEMLKNLKDKRNESSRIYFVREDNKHDINTYMDHTLTIYIDDEGNYNITKYDKVDDDDVEGKKQSNWYVLYIND